MIACNRETGIKFINEQLSVEETESFEAHLEACENCRIGLESAASDPASWLQTSDLLRSSSELPCWAGSPGNTRSLWDANSSENIRSLELDLSILAPTDDPESLGRIGGYEVSGVIGRGGMGVVFKAVDRSLNRNVAIKVLDPSFVGVGAARSRFAREARAMAAISHEHVVPIYAVDEHRGLPYFAMEYVPGGTLEARLRASGTLDTLSIVRIAHQVALALAAAHDSGLVHRDIKPANILLDRGVERVRVTDFGLARVANDASHTRSGFVAGTPQFMSPEQVRGETCNAQSDLFSLGCVMYAMCVGHSPFRAESLYGSMQRIVHDQPRPIRLQNAEIPSWLEQFILRLLAKDPHCRFASASEIAGLLEQELSYLQNPHSETVPQRSWITQREPFRRMQIQFLKYAAGVFMSAILLTSITWTAIWLSSQNSPQSLSQWGHNKQIPAQDASATNSRVSETVAQSAPEAFMPAYGIARNWDAAADVELVRQRASELQQSIFNSQTPNVDPWDGEVARIHQRIFELSNEMP